MELLVEYQIHVFSLLILLTLFFILKRSKVKSYGKNIIYWMILAAAFGIILEPTAWIFDESPYTSGFYAEYISNFFLFLAGPILTGLSLSYVDYHIYRDIKKVRNRVYYQCATIINLVLLLTNIYNPIYYYVDKTTHKFVSCELIWIHYGLVFLLYVYMIYLLICNRKRILPREQWQMLLFFSLPIIGMVLQFFEIRLYLAWTAPVIGILGIYIFLESTPSDEDFLTKLYNRKSYEIYLEYLIMDDNLFGIVLFDLDKFKEINDTYGHKKGDDILIQFATILKEVYGELGLIARLGGDEFAVVLNNHTSCNEVLLEEVKVKIFSHDDPIIHKLKFSFGCKVYEAGMDIKDLYSMADNKLYQCKRRSRQ